MTMNPKPDNEPDSNDMAGAFDEDGPVADVPTTHPNLEEEEAEAARLGDFA